MLVKFAIDPDALSCAEGDAFYRFYRNWWPSYGILADPRGSGSALTCKSKYLDELQTAYKHFEDYGWPLFCETRPIDWQNMQSASDLAKYRDDFGLALLEDTRALVFGVPDGDGKKYSKDCDGVEATRFRHADLSTKFEPVKRLSQQAIPIGQRTADLWRDRFQTLAGYSNGNQITIVDRYIAANILDKKKIELFRLLKLINTDSTMSRVTIYSSNRGGSVAKVKERIENRLEQIGPRKNGISQLTMHICPDDVFGNFAHDRHVSFRIGGGGVVCTIDIGIEIFRYDEVDREAKFSLKPPEHIGTYRKNEGKLRDEKIDTWRWRRDASCKTGWRQL